MPILYKGKLYETPGVTTIPPDPKLTWKLGTSGTRKRTTAITQMVWHWSASERDQRGCFQTLSRRGLSVQLFNRFDGVIFQYVDLAIVCAHAGPPTNGRSIGIEQQNVGHGRPNPKWPRTRLPETIHGVTRQTSLFTAEQLGSAWRLRCVLSTIIPELGPVSVDPRTDVLPLSFRNKWRGDLAHYQISSDKRDPGVHFMEFLIATDSAVRWHGNR